MRLSRLYHKWCEKIIFSDGLQKKYNLLELFTQTLINLNMTAEVGKIGDEVEVRNYPTDGAVAQGRIVTRTLDETVRPAQRYRGVIIDAARAGGEPVSADLPMLSLSPEALVLKEKGDGPSAVGRYICDYVAQANAAIKPLGLDEAADRVLSQRLMLDGIHYGSLN